MATVFASLLAGLVFGLGLNLNARPADLQEVLREGSDRARAVAAETMADVRDAMKMPTL